MANALSSYGSPDRSAKPPASWRSPRLKPIELMWRALALRAKAIANPQPDPLRDYRDAQDFPLLAKSYELITRAATSPGTTTTSGWAAELITSTARQFGAALAPGIFGLLTTIIDGFEFDGGPLPRIPARTATPTANGSFFAEGNPIPVRRVGLTSTTLTVKKLGVISTFTSELLKGSQINLETYLRTEIERDTRTTIDQALVDASASDAIRPAGLRNGIAGLTATASGTPTEKMVADLKQLLAAISPSVRPVIIANGAQALSLAWAGAAAGIGPVTVISSPVVTAGMVIALDADSFAYALDAPIFETSTEATVHEDDTPLAIIAAGPTPAFPVRSLWQTDVHSLRLIWTVNWALTRSNGAAWMTGVGW